MTDDTFNRLCEHDRIRAQCSACIPDPVVVMGIHGYYVRSFEHQHRTKPKRTRELALADWDALASGAYV